ncbi:MAG: glycosyltransferase [Candidatus Dojkabacteria bacterium]|nr:MAG: glycosyltransferase [Candidatus Dojkabacteria bacterium]
MKQKLPISVVIPTYNEEKMLPRLLKSLESQEFLPEEIIVADSPRTTDKTKEIAKAHKVKLVEGGLVGVGRNNGAAVATSEIIMFLDADAVLPHEYFLGEVYVTFKKLNLDIASTLLLLDPTEQRDFLNSLAPRAAFRTWNSLKKLHSMTNRVFADSGTGIIVKRELFKKIGGFREDDMIGEDAEFTMRASKMGLKYKVLPLSIISSGRRYETPQKATKAIMASLLTAGVIGLGLYNSESIVKFVRKLYGDLGGTADKK